MATRGRRGPRMTGLPPARPKGIQDYFREHQTTTTWIAVAVLVGAAYLFGRGTR